MIRGPSAQVWVRLASRRAFDTLPRPLEAGAMEAPGEAERLSLAIVDCLLRTFEGLVPWRTDADDLERLPLLVPAVRQVSRETAGFFERQLDLRTGAPPAREQESVA